MILLMVVYEESLNVSSKELEIRRSKRRCIRGYHVILNAQKSFSLDLELYREMAYYDAHVYYLEYLVCTAIILLKPVICWNLL